MLATTRLMTSTTSTSVPAASATSSNTIQSLAADAPKHISGTWVWIPILVVLFFPFMIGCRGAVMERRQNEQQELERRRRQPDWELYP
jgi:hypothetical protein